MIICGYLTIGKTTLAKDNLKIIDLDSKPFSELKLINSKWYEIYGDIALDLEKQGYIVLVSANTKVIKYLMNKANKLLAIIYSKKLKEYALKKAKERQGTSQSTIKAIEDNFNTHNERVLNICRENNINLITIENEDYNLKELLKTYIV